MNKISEAKCDMSGTKVTSSRVYLSTVRASPRALPTGQFFFHLLSGLRSPLLSRSYSYIISHQKQFPLMTFLHDLGVNTY